MKAQEKYRDSIVLFKNYLYYHPEMKEFYDAIKFIKKSYYENLTMYSTISVGNMIDNNFHSLLTGTFEKKLRIMITELDNSPYILFQTRIHSICGFFIDRISYYEIDFKEYEESMNFLHLFITHDGIDYDMKIAIA